MTHDETLARLDARADGTLPAGELAEVERHLAECAACRHEAEALGGLLADARALPRELVPGRDLWGGIEGRLAPRAPVTVSSIPPRRWRPLLLAAVIAMVLLGGAVLLLLRPPARPSVAFTREQARYLAASTELARALARDPGQLAPETQAVVGRSLSVVDQAIAEAEAALRADPRNPGLEQMLLARYAQRLELLQRATEAKRQAS